MESMDMSRFLAAGMESMDEKALLEVEVLNDVSVAAWTQRHYTDVLTIN
jgi:hypothetical protein